MAFKTTWFLLTLFSLLTFSPKAFAAIDNASRKNSNSGLLDYFSKYYVERKNRLFNSTKFNVEIDSRMTNADKQVITNFFMIMQWMTGVNFQLSTGDGDMVFMYSDYPVQENNLLELKYKDLIDRNQSLIQKKLPCLKIIATNDNEERDFLFINRRTSSDARASCIYSSIRSLIGIQEAAVNFDFPTTLIYDMIIMRCMAVLKSQTADGNPTKEAILAAITSNSCVDFENLRPQP